MVDSKDFAVGIFDALARRRRQNLERISKDELYDFWLQISDQSFDARLQIFFDMVDTNVDGRITREEVQELIVLSASANKLSKLKEQAEEYAALIMEELDPENLGYIELWQLEALLLQRDTYMTYSRPLSSGSAAQWSQGLSAGGAGGQPAAAAAAQQKQQACARMRRRWSPRRAAARARVAAAEGWRRAWVLALWAAAMAALFAWRFVEYRRSAAFRVMGYCLPTAKGAAETLKLNMALVLLPVCRNTLTWARSTWARYFVPFDDGIAFHKTWMYISVPLVLYVGERTLRAFRSKAYAVKILKVCLLPGNVLTITMSKPYGFRYRSGQYIFLQCPTISPFEWHPFSITSAPGDDYISVHIQTRGDWTQELKRIFVENYFTPSVPRRAAFGDLGAAEQKSPPRLLVDGPYGAPAQDFRNYDVLLLVGLGIGATPFISILRDLLNNIKLADELMDLAMETGRPEDSANSFGVSTASSSNKRRAYRTSCAHFYWVTREPGSFEWFKGVMNEVAEMDKKGVIELHNYLTSVYEERDARTTLLSMVQALNHAKHGVDIVSGTRVRTHFARPNWKEVFTRIASKHPNSTVGVFYCGRPTLAKELKKLSLDMSHRTGTRFDFHKEYF
ncbi:hypothetical protein PVAP13_6NG241100 [Panicum virgatum]|uniref:Uncharacterized protein n=2 Tax=Panicum virgatum TaxID=38727 RepID=A0A8T0R0Z5_PANVG|nr:hypothetical protein PVAP13_6NG241100 [Panicum virgatum]